ncbi:tetraspanin-5-like [Octopus sinensis]|uniref:Tetraspanin-5-like n=1 Tax=Octopus sinensis TaxID=2607531 RepID=A0A7E6EG44_9MOLL|nr:tetraspanin-5-like [Octopus sinensis]
MTWLQRKLAVEMCMILFHLFQLVGAALVGIGIWAYIEKTHFNHAQIENIYDAIFDISLIFIILGIIIFILGLTGYIGALRENICLLYCFNILLGGIFLFLFGASVAAFLLKDKFIGKLTSIFQENVIPKYTEDDDTKSLVNWIQEQVSYLHTHTHTYIKYTDIRTVPACQQVS